MFGLYFESLGSCDEADTQTSRCKINNTCKRHPLHFENIIIVIFVMCIFVNCIFLACNFVILRVFVAHCVYCCFTLDAGLLARSRYPEGPATGHLDTGFS